MRNSLLISAAATSLLTLAAAAGVTHAGGSDLPAAPSTTLPGLDILGDLGFTPEQTQCLVDNVLDVDTNDLNAMMALMTECGIDPLALTVPGATNAAIGTATTTPSLDTSSTTLLAGPPTTSPGATPALDPAAIGAVLAVMGIDDSGAQCLQQGLAAATSPGDDNEALAILQSCGLSLTDLLNGVLAAHAASAAGTATVTTVAGPDTTGAGPGSTTGAISSNPMIAQIQQLLVDQYGIVLNDDQVGCLVDNFSEINMDDIAATMGVFESCGISLTDLTPQGSSTTSPGQ